MAYGKVKWFNDARGFGMIEKSGGDREIFVHYSSIFEGSSGGGAGGSNRKTLQPGQEVEFDLYETPKGLTAQNVKQRN
jgi:CspA family cold shock protein